MRKLKAILASVSLLALFGAAHAPARADAISDFYGKARITFNVGTTVGGGYDFYARILAEYLPKHIPGGPTIVIENMGGAGGVKSANYVYNIAARDGSVISMPVSSIVLAEALRPSQVKFQSRKFGWVGTVATMTDVLAVYRTTGIATIDDAKKKAVVIGATGKLGTLYLQVALVNALLDTRFKIVPGYKSGNEANLAMDSGEIQGRTNQWVSWKTQRPQWIRDDKLSYLVQFGPKVPELKGVPTMDELVAKPREKAMVNLMQIIQLVGRAVMLPPDVPQARLAALRAGFDATMTDKAFIARMAEKDLELSPRPGATLQADIDNVMSSAEDTAKALLAELRLN